MSPYYSRHRVKEQASELLFGEYLRVNGTLESWIPNNVFGQHLDDYRRTLDLSLRELSTLLGSGFSPASISLFERGIMPPLQNQKKSNTCLT